MYLTAEDVQPWRFSCPSAVEILDDLRLTSIINDAIRVDRSSSTVLEFLLRRASTGYGESAPSWNTGSNWSYMRVSLVA
jgi:hypothetical protein